MGYGIKRVPPFGSGLKSVLTVIPEREKSAQALFFLDLAVEIPALGHIYRSS